VFEAIASNALKLCAATVGGVLTFDGELIHVAAELGGIRDEMGSLVGSFPMPPSRSTAAGRAILTRAIVHIPDLREDAEYRLHRALDAAGFRCIHSVPMLRDGDPIGAISVGGAEPAMFTERQIAMLQTFADQAVIAIENTRLFNELQTRTRELARSVER